MSHPTSNKFWEELFPGLTIEEALQHQESLYQSLKFSSVYQTARPSDNEPSSSHGHSRGESSFSGSCDYDLALDEAMARSLQELDLEEEVDRTAITESLRTTSRFLDEIQYIILQAWHLKWELVLSFSPFVLVLGAFIAFVYWNGSVVLGAKEAHAVSQYFAQIMYFAAVSALSSASFHFTFNHATVLL